MKDVRREREGERGGGGGGRKGGREREGEKRWVQGYLGFNHSQLKVF